MAEKTTPEASGAPGKHVHEGKKMKKDTQKQTVEYDAIMAEITSGLTGNSENDRKYLDGQAEHYKSHALSEEILRGIGRIWAATLPKEMIGKLENALQNHELSVNVALDEAVFQAHSKKDYVRAVRIVESLLEEVETGDGTLLMYQDDAVNEYHQFQNIFEEILYCHLRKPQRAVRRMTGNFFAIYAVYGGLLFELKRFDDARKALTKAAGINPVNSKVLFELAEIDKLQRNWDGFLALTKQCLAIAYTGEDLGRCYRNLGFYHIEQKNYNTAIALFHFSMVFDPYSEMANAELQYIHQITGKSTQRPAMSEVEKILAENNIALGPSEPVVGLSAALGEKAEQQKNYAAAKFFYSILYDVTHDSDIKTRIESLPQ